MRAVRAGPDQHCGQLEEGGLASLDFRIIQGDWFRVSHKVIGGRQISRLGLILIIMISKVNL